MPQPTLSTARLCLRPFVVADAARVQLLAGDPAVADTTLTIPHPYPAGAAEAWIGTHAAAWESHSHVTFAIEFGAAGLVGAIGLSLSAAHQRGEVGYWIGQAYWGKGIATEALVEVLRFAFTDLGLNRVQAGYFPRNPASGRVMEKAGMRFEGIQRQHVRKSGRFEDVACYAILRDEWLDRGTA